MQYDKHLRPLDTNYEYVRRHFFCFNNGYEHRFHVFYIDAVKLSMFQVLENKDLPINRNISVGRGTSFGEMGLKFSIPIQM